jgi:hypothetical protein
LLFTIREPNSITEDSVARDCRRRDFHYGIHLMCEVQYRLRLAEDIGAGHSPFGQWADSAVALPDLSSHAHGGFGPAEHSIFVVLEDS